MSAEGRATHAEHERGEGAAPLHRFCDGEGDRRPKSQWWRGQTPHDHHPWKTDLSAAPSAASLRGLLVQQLSSLTPDLIRGPSAAAPTLSVCLCLYQNNRKMSS